MSSNKLKIGSLILAAGSSSRLGTPKQLVNYRGQPLLARLIDLLEESELDNIYVVTGSQRRAVEKSLSSKACKTIYCPQWQEGMGTSLGFGIEKVDKSLDAILILTCDQYRLEKININALLEACHKYPEKIIASSFENTCGVPAVFPKKNFAQLQSCRGPKGAKFLIDKYPKELHRLPLPNAAYDLDNREDLCVLKKFENLYQR